MRGLADVMEAWLSVRSELAPDAIEIDQLDMMRERERIADCLTGFLDIPAREAATFLEAQASERPERTASHFGHAHDLESSGWSASEINNFKEICGAMMAVCGYGHSMTHSKEQSLPRRE